MVHIVFIVAIFLSIPILNRKVPFYLLSFMILFTFLALRYNFGNDYKSYMDIHRMINDNSIVWGQKEILFWHLNKVIPNYYLFLAVCSLFYIIVMYCLIVNNTKLKHIWISLTLLLFNAYLFLTHLSSIRQTIALCIFCIAVRFIIKRKFIIYLFLVIIAAAFHQSAIILIPVYFLASNSKLNKKGIVICTSVLMLLLFTPLFNTISYKLLELFPRNYTHYFEQGVQSSLRSAILSGVIYLIIILNINKLEGRQLVYGKLSLISAVISILAIKVSMMTRIGMYFDIFIIVTIPNIMELNKNRISKKLIFMIVLIIYLGRYISFFIWNQEFYGVYTTILGK